jgi:hypothetical protein
MRRPIYAEGGTSPLLNDQRAGRRRRAGQRGRRWSRLGIASGGCSSGGRNLSVRCAVEAHELAGHADRRPRHGASLSIAHFFEGRAFPARGSPFPPPHQTTRIEPIPLIVAPSASMLGPSSALGSSGACGDSICRSVLYLRSRLSLSSSSSAVSGASVQKLKRSGVAGDRKMGTPRVRFHQPRHRSPAAIAQVSATFWQHLLAPADERISVIRSTPLCRK